MRLEEGWVNRKLKKKLFGLCWIEARNKSDNLETIGVCHWFNKYKVLRKITIMNDFLEDKWQCKFEVVMTVCHHVIFITNCVSFWWFPIKYVSVLRINRRKWKKMKKQRKKIKKKWRKLWRNEHFQHNIHRGVCPLI